MAAGLCGPEPASEASSSGTDAPFVVASLTGIEDRLSAIGERPMFREAGLGRLVHVRTTATAAVSFWPGTLKWSVAGPGSSTVEDALVGARASRPESSGPQATVA